MKGTFETSLKQDRVKDLDSFLQEQQDGLFDSTGSFTIAADKALEKLAHSQLPDPAYWVLKLAQFATVMEVDSVGFSMKRKVTEVRMNLPRSISIAELQSGLGSLEPLEDPALEDLVTALRALGGAEDCRFALLLGSPEGSEILTWDGQKLGATLSDKTYDHYPLILDVTSSSSFSLSSFLLDKTAHRRAREVQALRQKAFTVPYTLIADGSLPGAEGLHSSNNYSVPFLLDFQPSDSGFTPPGILRGLLQKTLPSAARSEREKLLHEASSSELKLDAFWYYRYEYTLTHPTFSVRTQVTPGMGRGSFHWLRNGVVVNTWSLSFASSPVSVDIFADSGDCPTDLGGLRLRQTPELKERVRWAGELLQSICQKATRDLPLLELPTGASQGGWAALKAGFTYMPLDSPVRYRTPCPRGRALNDSPYVRKQLLKNIKSLASRRGPLQSMRLLMPNF